MNDWQTGFSGNSSNPPQQVPFNRFAMYALVFGIISVVTIATGVLPLFFGSLSILFAILSRTGTQRLTSTAKWGMIVSTGSIMVAIFLSIMVIYLINTNGTYREKFNQTFQQSYGISFDDYWHITESLYETGELPPLPEGCSQEFIDYYHSLEEMINDDSNTILPMDSGTGGDP